MNWKVERNWVFEFELRMNCRAFLIKMIKNLFRQIPRWPTSRKVYFSSNKEVIVESVAQYSLVAQRVICDHVRSAGGVPQVAFCKELLLSAASESRDTMLPLMRKEE